MTPQEQTTKEKIDILGLIKVKNFDTPKGSVKKVERDTAECEKVVSHDLSHKVFVSRIYK